VNAAKTLVGLRVLVVEDDDDSRELLAALLKDAGAWTHAAASAGEAFELLPTVRPHVVVSDIAMPGEDGYAFIQRIRLLAPADGGTVPAIALTAYTQPQDRAKAFDAGFTAHLSKPVSSDELLAAVANLGAARAS
jgi:CheY-like chemotaxis protein